MFFVGGGWASRKGHGLRARNGTPEQRIRRALLAARDDAIEVCTTPGKHRATRERSIERLHKLLRPRGVLPDALWPLDDLMDDAAAERQARRRNALRSRHPLEYTLFAQIENSCAAHGSVELGSYLVCRARDSVQPQIFEIGKVMRPWSRQDHHLCLDLGTLRTVGLMSEGQVTARLLSLPDVVAKTDRLLLVVDLRSGAPSVDLAFMDQYPTIITSQSIRLVERPNMPGRLYLKCPLAGTSHDRLFFRDGFFASAARQRLKTKSQTAG